MREPSAWLLVRELQLWNSATACATKRCIGVSMSSQSRQSLCPASKNATKRISTSARVFKPTPRRNRSRALAFSRTNLSAAPAICLRREPPGAFFESSGPQSISRCCSSVMSRKSDMSCKVKCRDVRDHTATERILRGSRTLAACPPPDHKKAKELCVVTRNRDRSSSGSMGCFSCISFSQRWWRRLPGRPGDCRDTMLRIQLTKCGGFE